MRKTIATGFVLLVLGVGSPGAARSAEPEPRGAARWEYRILTKDQVLELGKKDLAAGLNKLGDDGWELVAAPPAEGYIFKRPRERTPKQLEDVKRQVLLAESDVEMW